MMAVDANVNGGTFAPGVPKALFDTGLAQNDGYDVGKDGRFLIPRAVEGGAGASLTIVVNWTAALKK